MRKILFACLLVAGNLLAQTPQQVRSAIARALPSLDHSTAAFVAKRACVSCHHNVLSLLMFRMARERGIAIDSTVQTAVESKTFHSLLGPAAFDDAVQEVTLNDPTPDDSYLLMAAHASDVAPDLTTAVYARRLLHWQRYGHWVTSDFRPPHSSSIFTATATAVRAISLYMPEELHTERDTCILRARQWLVKTKPVSTEDAAFRLLGLVWSGAATREVEAARNDLLAMRKPAGGSEGSWAELPRYPADAYSTGESLFALHEAGMTEKDPAWQAGLRFLIFTQAGDGTWLVHTRMTSPAQVSPEYFTTGFPYGKSEYLSYAGSTWAVMALLSALPQAALVSHAAPERSAVAPVWARTALFGTTAELTALLDHGLDPNSKTAKGTTLLMAASNDSDKVRLLLARGAKPAYGDLSVAAASRDTAAPIKLLLDAGAPVNAPEGSHTKANPLVFASMTGDLGNVRLLLAHGADSLSSALSQAVTFGYPDVVRTLLSAGASAKMTDSSGINLLHWAAITNRADVMPDLAKAGVAINAKDDAGFTPLMYAVTIDFEDMATLRALIKAGADPKIRNDQGRTAIDQARQYRHVNLETVLK